MEYPFGIVKYFYTLNIYFNTTEEATEINSIEYISFRSADHTL